MNSVESAVAEMSVSGNLPAALEVVIPVVPSSCWVDAATAAGEAAEAVFLNARAYANAARAGLQRAVRADYGFVRAEENLVAPAAVMTGLSGTQLIALRADSLI